MSEKHQRYRATIMPVPEGTPRPFWSVMVPTYNCAAYLRETLASVLAQAPGPEVMQIDVVDDHSTRDDPEAVVAELGRGRVGFYRQPHNVGHTRNFQTCLERARGQVVHLLHGDDCVRDGFYRRLQAAFEQHPELGAAFCRHLFMDEQSHWQAISALERSERGILDNWLPHIAVGQRIQTPSIVVRREVYERLGLFDSRLSWVEDWEMWVRIAAHYPVWYEVEPLAVYRMHANSSSGRHLRSGKNMRDVQRAIAIISTYLPPAFAAEVRKRSREHWALEALRNNLPALLYKGELDTACIQVREVLRFSRSPRVLGRLIPVLLRMGKMTLKRGVSYASGRARS